MLVSKTFVKTLQSTASRTRTQTRYSSVTWYRKPEVVTRTHHLGEIVRLDLTPLFVLTCVLNTVLLVVSILGLVGVVNILVLGVTGLLTSTTTVLLLTQLGTEPWFEEEERHLD